MTNKKETLNLQQLPDDVKAHIDQLERVRQDFVANVSHELRTPLTVIRGYLETLIKNNDKETEKYQAIFSQMYQHSLRMENIINDLLLLARLENEKEESAEFSEINVASLLEALCLDARHVGTEKNQTINLEVDKHLKIQGVEEELKSLFSNLIINAVKYTPANGKITVKWYQKNNQAVFSVTDTGIGIAEAHIPRITERFYRVDKARSRNSGGTGLGLAIAKHVLMRHHGSLKIKSQLNKGSTFTCFFPIVTKSS